LIPVHAPALGSGGNDKADAQRHAYVVAEAHTLMRGGRYESDTETFIAGTLTSGSPPGSNMPGRRREDDGNLVAFDWQSGGDVRLNIGPTTSALVKEQTPAVTSHAGVRRLTPVECERLQGLPDGWTDLGPDSRRYAALGDAVTANVAEWIGRRLLANIRSEAVA